MYLQNRSSYQEVCADPTDLFLLNETSTSIDADWTENGIATQWEILYGKATSINDENFVEANNNGSTGATIEDLLDDTNYSFYVRAICGPEQNSNWVGPVNKRTILNIQDAVFAQFQFYPNPANATINLVAAQTINSTRIFDALGKEVLSQRLDQTFSSIDVSRMTPGIYFMEVTIGNASKVYKFIKK